MNDEKKNRERRRRRRLKNQILAYLMLLIIIALILAAGYYGVKGVMNYMSNYSDKVNRVIEEAESSLAAEQESEPYVEEVQGNIVQNNEGFSSPVDTDLLNSLIESLLSDMTIEEMVAGLFIVSPEAITGVGTVVQAGDGTKAAVTENPVGGLIYAPKNFKSSEQFTEMITKTRSYAKYPLFTIVQAECGTSDYGLETTAKASELTETDSVVQAYGSIASVLASYGINMNLAPVAEIVSEDGEPSLQGRTFGSDASVAAPLVNVAVQALQEVEVSAVLQKFPGVAAGSKSLEELKNSEFVIYDMAIKNGVDCIMVSHIQVNGVTGDETPSSLSSVMINDVLRNTLGFNGVVMTDALDDSAVTGSYSSAEAAVAAIQAGADLLLSPENYQEAYEGVLQAVTDGTITKERIHDSLYRIYCVKYKNVIDSL
ncbi:MAG: glycoside hydrolase family 3 protein [Lachnospiraceae bacterium]|nr:glycoside hydrolase family 3 protein [Lachnospiraceae bacterium]